MALSLVGSGQWSLGGGAALHAERIERAVYFGPIARAEFRISERWSTRASGFWAVPKRSEVDWTSNDRGSLASGIPPHTRFESSLLRTLSAVDVGCAMRLGKVQRNLRKGYAIVGMGASIQRMHTRSRGQRTDLTTGYITPVAYDHTRWLGGLILFSGYERDTRRGSLFIEGHLLLQAERHRRWSSSPAARFQMGCRLRLSKS